MAPGQAHLTLSSPSNQTYSILVSTNLLDWNPVGPLPPVSFDEAAATATYLVELDPKRPIAAYQVAYQPVPPNPEPFAALEAPADATVSQHLPDMGMPFERETDVEFIKGVLPISRASILVTFKDTTTVQMLNDLLDNENLSLAGAVPLMNLGLLRRNQITTLEDLNAQTENLAASGLFNSVAINLGMLQPSVVDDPPPSSNLAGTQVPEYHWSWEVVGLGMGMGGNNGLEMSRIPQLWNWLDYGHRQITRLGGHRVAVFDVGFTPHNELLPEVTLGFVPNVNVSQSTLNHGTAVTGIIAARNDNKGTQGVTSLPNPVSGIPWPQGPFSGIWQQFSSISLSQLASLLYRTNAPKLINVSMGIPYYSIGNPTQTNIFPGTTFADWVDKSGKLWADCFWFLNHFTATTNYLVVCSAGNDSGVDARYNSPMANIACRPELHALAPQFITVENVSENRITKSTSNFSHSRTGHAVSAGGTDVTVLHGPWLNDYKFFSSGTSYAAPLVTGLASFLWSLDPSLTVLELKSLLLNSNTTFEVQSSERGNLVDGFAAALGIDLLRTNLNLQRALVDVDDGTLDGNLRRKVLAFEMDPDAIHTADGRRGDGKVNMKDFRVFRDAWLQVIGSTTNLDGAPRHFKRDLNFDGLIVDQPVSPPHPAPYSIGSRTGASLAEAIYCRFDFNGNGRLDLETDRGFPVLEAISPFKTDPDTPVTGRNVSQGLLRDVDVLLSRFIWEQDEENVLVTGSHPSPGVYELPPVNWTTNALNNLSISYLRSFDLHVDMEAGDPDSWDERYLDHPVTPFYDGLWVDSYFNLTKARSGAWQGVITIPFDKIGDIPTVFIYYKKTVGNEFHQYAFGFVPELGEDVGLSVGFDKLEFTSSTRGFVAAYLDDPNGLSFEETIAITPGGAPYGNFYVEPGEYDGNAVREEAGVLAAALLSSRLKFPSGLNGSTSPSFKAITKETLENGGTRVEIYGIVATYDSFIATQNTP